MECKQPPVGWKCSRPAGHDGPCAATRKNSISLKHSVHWVWFGFGFYPKIKAIDIMLPFTLVVITWGAKREENM